MELKNSEKRFDKVCEYLSRDVCVALLNIPKNIKEKAQEIILRVNKPLTVRCSDSVYYITRNGCVSSVLLSQQMLTVSKKDIMQAFQNICNYSVYSRQNEIVNGFVTVCGGHRAGICGTCVLNDKKVVNIKEISTVNIRIAREFPNCSDGLFKNLGQNLGSLLICGAPSTGKTTLIRDVARRLSTDCGFKVCVVDERGELAATQNGIAQNDLGFCDILDGYPKSIGIEQALRCMSPDYIVCDEIGSRNDFDAIENMLNCGVKFIATIHCDSKKSLLKRKNIVELLRMNAFEKAVFLESRQNAGKIKSIENCEVLMRNV